MNLKDKVCDDIYKILRNSGSVTSGDAAELADDIVNKVAMAAAAPELLEALQAITELYNTDEGCTSLPEYVNATEAIKKALGK